jgi:serine protease
VMNQPTSKDICRHQLPRRPINVPLEVGRPAHSGFIILRLRADAVGRSFKTLADLCHELKLSGLSAVLERFKLPSRALITAVKPEVLRTLEERAQRTPFPPRHSLAAYWRLDARGLGDELDAALQALRRTPEVDIAYPEAPVTDPVVNPGDDTFSTTQSYLDAAPSGIDARWAWTQANGEGGGVRLVDLEQGWFLGHEDLPGPVLIFNDNRDGVGGYKGNHGTSVLGEMAGVDNALGIVGIAPSLASVRVVSHYEAATNTALHVADAIVAAVAANPQPHALLLEVQRNLLPTETDEGDFDAIRLAVASGVIVVEAGGNGNMDLDAWMDSSGQFALNRTDPAFRESGAIIVGAGQSALPHDRSGFSNFGSRVDCYGWGDSIVTAGYGDLSAGSGDNSTYTSLFGGTSGASPMVTGAAVILQGMYLANTGSLLSPTQMRLLLSDPATGTPQGGGVAGAIGVMPNLRGIVEDALGLVPDVYLRDAIGDTGVVPSGGAISVSPDVIVRPVAVADPFGSFGEGSGTENNDTLGSEVEAGQDNYVYVRMRNRGARGASATTATVYWSEVASLVTPDMWNLIGTTPAISVPVGDTLTVTGAIIWPRANLPASSHACLIGVLHDPQDPASPLPPSTSDFDWNAFTDFIRNQNNVTWRNFNLIDVDPDPNADPVAEEFLLVGAPDRFRRFDLELVQRLPEGVRVWIEGPAALLGVLPHEPWASVERLKKSDRVRLALPFVHQLPLCGVRLGPGARHRCHLVVRGAKGLARGLHRIALRQLHEGLEVGRITWGLRMKVKGGVNDLVLAPQPGSAWHLQSLG